MLVLENVRRYTPVLSWGTTAPTAPTIAKVGTFQRVGKLVFYTCKITFTDVGSGGSGALNISLPSVQSSEFTGYQATMNATANVIACPTNTNYLSARIASKKLQVVAGASDESPVQAIVWADLANGDIVEISGFYYEQ